MPPALRLVGFLIALRPRRGADLLLVAFAAAVTAAAVDAAEVGLVMLGPLLWVLRSAAVGRLAGARAGLSVVSGTLGKIK